jgi:NhaP-type Na+/H+ or K+/H+ antiporter
MLGLIPASSVDTVVEGFSNVALFGVLFTDGMNLDLRRVRSEWAIHARILILGMPLTFCTSTALAFFFGGLDLSHAALVGAALNTSDPVIGSAIASRREVGVRLGQALTVESGLSEFIALPGVVLLVEWLTHAETDLGVQALDMGLGVALGAMVPQISIRLERLKLFRTAEIYEPLHAFAVALIIFGVASITRANIFLASFAAGISVASCSNRLYQSFSTFGELLVELLKLAALFEFGALLSMSTSGFDLWTGVFAVLVLLLTRPLSMLFALSGTPLPLKERIAVGWLGPRGFSSVVYGLYILNSKVSHGDTVFRLVAAVVVLSILFHSSTDAFLTRKLGGGESEPVPERTPT